MGLLGRLPRWVLWVGPVVAGVIAIVAVWLLPDPTKTSLDRFANSVQVVGVVLIALYLLETWKMASASASQAKTAKKTLKALQDEYERTGSDPDIRAIPPPVIVFENDPKEEDDERHYPLRLYVPLTFTNTGGTPGVISDLGVLLEVPTKDGRRKTWQTDWPGPNDPVHELCWEPLPIRVPAHGSEGRTIKLHVRDYNRAAAGAVPWPSAAGCVRPESPAKDLAAGELRLRLYLQRDLSGDPQPEEWEWRGNVDDLDVKALGGEESCKRRIGRYPGMWERDGADL